MKKQTYIIFGVKIVVRQGGLLPLPGFSAINLYPFAIYTRGRAGGLSQNTLRHEAIHTIQAKEMLIVPYYFLYILEYFVKILLCWNLDKAYKSISFEQEAYFNSRNLNYGEERKRFAWWEYVFRMYKQTK